MSKKSTDNHNRWRSLTVAFRISPDENEVLNRKVYLCGCTKQTYIINNLIGSEPLRVVVNRKIICRLAERIAHLANLLENASNLTVCDTEELRFITKLLLQISEAENTKE